MTDITVYKHNDFKLNQDMFSHQTNTLLEATVDLKLQWHAKTCLFK